MRTRKKNGSRPRADGLPGALPPGMAVVARVETPPPPPVNTTAAPDPARALRVERDQLELEVRRLRAVEEAREEGAIACQAGRALEENPHDEVELAAAWAAGWVATDVVWCLSHMQHEASRLGAERERLVERVSALERELGECRSRVLELEGPLAALEAVVDAMRLRRSARRRYDEYWQARGGGDREWSMDTLNQLAVARREADRALDIAIEALDDPEAPRPTRLN
jgi:hypothetical protein